MADERDYIKVIIVTPFGTQAEIDVSQMRAPGSEGDFGVLPGHLPFLTSLRIGSIILDTDKGKRVWATSGGYVEVLGDHVTILAETAERAEKIDVERAERAKERALQRISEVSPDIDFERSRISLARAINRIKVASSTRLDG